VSPGRLLVTTSHSLLHVDTESGAFKPLHRGAGLYFGMASDAQVLYVAARGRMVSSAVSPEAERGRVLVFDRALCLADEIAAPFALRDMHEMLWHAGRLYITCSYDNMVAVADLASGNWDRWYPLGRPEEPPCDVNHLNSLAMVDGTLAVVAHNKGPSEMLRYDLASRALVERVPFGVQAHNIRRNRDGALFTCSSAEGCLVGADGWRLATGGFPRGVLLTEDEAFVGISEIAERGERDLTTGRIAVYDAGWGALRSFELPGEGLVLDLFDWPPAS
jgi:hypothetical protein